MTGHLLTAELRKVTTVRGSWAVLGAATGLTVLAVIGTAANAGATLPALTTAAGARDLYAAPHQVDTLLGPVLGALCFGSEIRHRTIAQTLLTTPRRGAVMRAKTIAGLVVGLLLGLSCQLVGTVVAAGWLAQHGDELHWSQAALAGVGTVAVTALCTAIGLGVGAVVRNQVVSVVVVLAWFLAIEGLLIQLTPPIGRWLPGGAAAAAAGSSLGTRGELLPPLFGAALTVAYAVAAVSAGRAAIARFDTA